MASFRQRTSGRWQAIVRRDGAPDQSKTFSTKRDAEVWAATVESEIGRGLYIDRGDAEKNTFSKIVKRYREDVLPNLRGRDKEKYRLDYLEEYFGQYSLAAITPALIAAYRDQRLKTLAPQTVLHEINLISRVMKAASMDWGISLPQGLPTTLVRKPKAGNGRSRRLEKDEEARLFASLESSKNRMMPAIVSFAIETAARQSEIASLVWEDVNLDKQVANLRGIEGRATKNADIFRAIPLSRRSVAILESVKPKTKAGKTPTGSVFISSTEAIKQAFAIAVGRARTTYVRETLQSDLVNAGFTATEAKAEIHKVMPRGGPKKANPKPPRKQTERLLLQLKRDPLLVDLHFRDLRHEATSRLAEKLEMHELMKVTGHKSTAMLARYYHPRAEDLARKLG